MAPHVSFVVNACFRPASLRLQAVLEKFRIKGLDQEFVIGIWSAGKSGQARVRDLRFDG